MNNKYW